MKKSINNFGRALGVLLLCAGLVFVSCIEGVLGEDQNSEQEGDNNDAGNGVADGPVVDLSAKASANCYVVSEAGVYRFKTVTGNNRSLSVGDVASASVLWESFGTDVTPNVGDLVADVKYEDGAIVFKTLKTFKEGNAGTMMDRNLGATSATPGDVGALGLLYQWGRKDPFLGSSSISSSILAKSTITWPSVVLSNSTNGTISYATANPTTFIDTININLDWYYSDSSLTDNTRWTTNEIAKSIYDPCPAGWRVPDGDDNGVWSKALGSSSSFYYTYDNTKEGMNFSGKFGSASTIWYPAPGNRGNNGLLGNVGTFGYCWAASPNGYKAWSLILRQHFGQVSPSSSGLSRVNAFPVRCLQE